MRFTDLTVDILPLDSTFCMRVQLGFCPSNQTILALFKVSTRPLGDDKVRDLDLFTDPLWIR